MNDSEKKEPCGILLINKPAGFTSHDIVNKVRRLYGTRRVGHTGTLDPMATGLLVVLVGRAAKASEYAVTGDKKYIASMRLGIETDTEDITGIVISEKPVSVTPEEFEAAACKFRGEIMQIPPMYSALKRGGRKLCDIARSGETIERESRPVTVFDMGTRRIGADDYELTVHCSSGTYIRTICADIGRALGCGGTMTSLERTSTCGFSLSDSHTPDEIEALPPEERLSLLLPTEELFRRLAALKLPAFYERLFRSGCEIYLSKLKASGITAGEKVRICNADGEFFALGEAAEYPNGTAVRSLKLFSLE